MKDWKKLKLGNISAISYGYTAKASFEEIGPKFLRITDIQNETVNWEKVPSCPIDEDNLKKHRLIDQDIVFARTGATTGKSYLVCDPPKSVAASYLIRLRVNDPSISAKFISKYFQTYEYWENIASGISGSAQGGFNASKLAELAVAIPPIDEQKRIVAIVDQAFEAIDGAIENTKQNLANARELFDSYLNEIFTKKGDERELVSLSEITTDITDGDHQPPPKSESGVPFITISNINKQTRTVDFPNTFKVSPKYFQKIKYNKKPRRGDLLYTVTGSYGIPVIIDYDLDFCFQRHIGLIRPNSETDSRCLYYLLLSRHLLNQADECAIETAQKTVSLSGLRRFSVPKIPKKEQELIVAELDILSEKVRRLESIYLQKLAALTELKQSILQKAFTGELTADREAL